MINIFHIPVCPFCQRLEILAELKGCSDKMTFEVVDITVARDPKILELSGGSTALPVMDVGEGRALKESLVLMDFVDHRFPTSVRREDSYERGIENLMVTTEGSFTWSGYALLMNQDPEKREGLKQKYFEEHAKLNAFLERYSTGESPWLFNEFGWAEAVFTPMFQRFWFIDYYEDIDLPDTAEYARVRAWREACVEHPAAQQTSKEEVVKLYYDYSRGAGNGAILEGRTLSSFSFEPHWKERPWPPRDKSQPGASDQGLGLV